MRIEGTVVLQKASFLDFKDIGAVAVDKLCELMNRKVYFQLISGDQIDRETGDPTVSRKADLSWKGQGEQWTKDSIHRISFDCPSQLGTPGAVRVTNKHAREFFLKGLRLNVPGKGHIRFLCNSWIYPKWIAKICPDFMPKRIFFANNTEQLTSTEKNMQSYLPEETPKGLVRLMNAELATLKGNGTGKRETRDRVYDYDFYNDLGDPDSSKELDRKALGGSQHLPYPRRCRTGRPPTKTSLALESRKLQCITQSFYIPSDEEFPHESLSDFRAYLFRAFFKLKLPSLKPALQREFGCLKDVKLLYSTEIPCSVDMGIELLKQVLPGQMIKEFLNTDDKAILKFPLPDIISRNDAAWMTDEEFARQTLSGVNPMVIRCLQSFPPTSSLNSPQIYGPKESSITAEHILQYLDGISVAEAIETKRLFILDYYDAYMPYVELINKLPTSKIYSTRTIFFLAKGTLKPIAIELCLPPLIAGGLASRRVFTPDYSGEDNGWLWQLAKAHVRGNDSGYHQLVNHWLRTHAVVEPFVISTHRNLSKLHPLHKLLLPHFRNTLVINRTARESLINAGGIIERYFASGKYSMEISAKAYKEWRFNEQGLPADLLKRGMAVSDPTDKVNGLRLMIKDYPYAVDGLEIWAALKSWVSDYTSLYYKDDQTVQKDREFQAWWKEIVEVGHGDKKQDERGWYKMKSVEDVKEGITTLIWIASAHHAAVNFGQYGYAGFMPNYPTTTRRLIPEKGSREYSEFLRGPEAYFLKTVSDPVTAAYTMAVMELLSRHSTDEIYLGQVPASEWTDDLRVETAFQRFRSKLLEIEKKIEHRNANPKMKNRCGPVEVPYKLLYPGTSDVTKIGGLTFRGIPNSISI